MPVELPPAAVLSADSIVRRSTTVRCVIDWPIIAVVSPWMVAVLLNDRAQLAAAS